jgi:hypothetical protein
LSRGFHQPFQTWAEDVPAVELQFSAQLFDGLFMLSDSLIMELRRLVERGVEVINPLSWPFQQIVKFARMSRP